MTVPTQEQLEGLRPILHNNTLIMPWVQGSKRELDENEVQGIMAESEAAAEVVRIAGGVEEFVEKTQGGSLNPLYWTFYTELPIIWPRPQPKRDPFDEPINTPSNEPDKIQLARAGAITMAMLHDMLANALAKLDKIQDDINFIKECL